jgi:hypothetical protein
MTAHHLPAELTDICIDHLHNEKRSLSACGLTCKAWLPASRYHLFSDVLLRPNDYTPFCELLEAPSSYSVASVVRRLIFYSGPVVNHSSPIPRWPKEEIVRTHLHRLITLLQGVRYIKLSNYQIEASRIDNLIATLSNFSNLQHLELDRIKFEAFEHPIDVIHALPTLKSISVHNDYCFKNTYIPPDQICKGKHQICFRHLDIERQLGTTAHPWITWIISQNPTPVVSSLRLTGLLVGVDKLLETVGASIANLDWYLIVSDVAINIDIPGKAFPQDSAWEHNTQPHSFG